MYCVKCGVRLDDSLDRCPLCGTPVWRPEEAQDQDRAFSSIFPEKHRNERLTVVAFLTAVALLAAFITLRICLRIYGGIGWSGYAMLGIALFYVIAILPLWFRRPNPMIFLPVDHAAVAGFLLYASWTSGGHWFLSFGFPVTAMSCLLLTGFIALGGLSMLVEFFQHITFGTKMFTWSLYVVSSCLAFGMFLILAGTIRPLREYLERRFFL